MKHPRKTSRKGERPEPVNKYDGLEEDLARLDLARAVPDSSTGVYCNTSGSYPYVGGTARKPSLEDYDNS